MTKYNQSPRIYNISVASADQAEEIMVREYIQLFRKLRQVKALKDI